MKPWKKVALGCLSVAILALFVIVVSVVGLGYWARNQVLEISGGGPAVAEARRIANAIPFETPADKVIAESRLLQFIEVRSRVFSVYEEYRTEIESRVAKFKDGASIDIGDVSTGLTLMGKIQAAEALALAKHGMSEAEYAFISVEVYKWMVHDLGPGEGSKRAIEDAAGVAEKALGETLRSKATANLPPEAREAIAEAGAGIAAASLEVSREIDGLKTRPENVALFGKHADELRNYAMPGLNALLDQASRTAKDPKNAQSDKSKKE